MGYCPIRRADAEVLLPAKISLSKNLGDADDSPARTPWHICFVRQVSEASLTSSGERFKKILVQ